MKQKKLLIILLLLCFVSLITGPSTLRSVVNSPLLLIYSRIPRTVSVVLVGGSMSLSGLLMQTVSNNDFVGPTTVGTIEAAKLGLIVSLFTFQSPQMMQKLFFSFVSSVLFTALFLFMMYRLNVRNPLLIPLFGIIFAQLLEGICVAIAYRYDLSQNIASWIQGSFALSDVRDYGVLYLNLLPMAVSYLLIYHLTILRMGQSMSTSLGIRYRMMWLIVICMVALSSAVNVIVVGMLPFVGIIIPNIVRRWRGDMLRDTIIEVVLLGAIFVLICDIIAKLVIHPFEVPVGIVISLVGGVIFIYLILKKGRV